MNLRFDVRLILPFWEAYGLGVFLSLGLGLLGSRNKHTVNSTEFILLCPKTRQHKMFITQKCSAVNAGIVSLLFRNCFITQNIIHIYEVELMFSL